MQEFVEVAVPDALLLADNNLEAYQILLYNVFYGRLYTEDAVHPLTTFTRGVSSNGVTLYSKVFPPANCTKESAWCGLQNGKDGFALAQFVTPTSGRILEFWSYEGTFTAKDGPATNMTSTDVGVFQRPTTPKGWSIAKQGIGCHRNEFVWQASHRWTRGAVNNDQTITCAVAFVNEFHYDNEAQGDGQFVEVATNVDDVSAYSMVLYNGNDGLPYDAVPLSSFTEGDTTTEGLTFYYYEFPSTAEGLVTSRQIAVNGTMDTMDDELVPTAAGIALSTGDDVVVDFVSYGGAFEARGGVAEGLTSVDTGVEETALTPVGSSLQLADGTGCDASNFVWTVVESNRLDFAQVGDTRGAANVGQEIACVLKPTVEEEEQANSNNATTTAAVEDDFFADDDDFLDTENVVDYTTEVSKRLYYEKGPEKELKETDGP